MLTKDLNLLVKLAKKDAHHARSYAGKLHQTNGNTMVTDGIYIVACAQACLPVDGCYDHNFSLTGVKSPQFSTVIKEFETECTEDIRHPETLLGFHKYLRGLPAEPAFTLHYDQVSMELVPSWARIGINPWMIARIMAVLANGGSEISAKWDKNDSKILISLDNFKIYLTGMN